VRYELPPGLNPDDVRAIEAALDEYFGTARVPPDPWTLAGRATATRIGALQIRHQSVRPWGEIALNAYTRLGIEPRAGRSDTT